MTDDACEWSSHSVKMARHPSGMGVRASTGGRTALDVPRKRSCKLKAFLCRCSNFWRRDYFSAARQLKSFSKNGATTGSFLKEHPDFIAVVIMRYIYPKEGLVNGTRLGIKRANTKVLKYEGIHAGGVVHLERIRLTLTESRKIDRSPRREVKSTGASSAGKPNLNLKLDQWPPTRHEADCNEAERSRTERSAVQRTLAKLSSTRPSYFFDRCNIHVLNHIFTNKDRKYLKPSMMIHTHANTTGTPAEAAAPVCTSDMTRELSRRSSRARARMYSPKVSCIQPVGAQYMWKSDASL
eukprot:350266-Chlamydomonas_euryale.AAC.4